MADVFISYSRGDRPRATELRDALAALEVDVWFDVGIVAGSSFDREIERELAAAKAVVVLWSEASVASDWVRNEARSAKERGVLVAVELEPCQLPLEFRSVQAERLEQGAAASGDRSWAALAARIGELIGRPGLGAYVRLGGASGPARYRQWLGRYPSDPLVAVVVDRLADAAAPGVRDELNVERARRTALEAELAEHASTANARAGELAGAAREIAMLKHARDAADQSRRDAEAEAARLRAEAGDAAGTRAPWERVAEGTGIRLDQRLAYYVTGVLWLFVITFLAGPIGQLNKGYAGTDDIFWLVIGLIFLATPAAILTIKLLRRRALDARLREQDAPAQA